MTGITCFDSILNDQFMAGAAAYAAYVDGSIGNQPNYGYIVEAFPGAHHLSIALFATNNADCLDVESGAAEPSDIPGWHARQVARGIARPVVYANAFTMDAEVLPVLSAAGIPLSSVRLWCAHYGEGEHICGPHSCGQLSVNADGCQWTQSAQGLVLDQSLLLANFFGTTPAPAPVPAQAWQEAAVQALPVLAQNSTDSQAVRTLQGLLCARGHTVAVDGDFGSGTLAAVKAFQKVHGLEQDGQAGLATWPALLGVS